MIHRNSGSPRVLGQEQETCGGPARTFASVSAIMTKHTSAALADRGENVSLPRLTHLTAWSGPKIMRLVAEGMPCLKRAKNRGDEYIFNTADVFEWALRRGGPRSMTEDGLRVLNLQA